MRVNKNKDSWSITGLNESEMRALVSMVRLEIGSGAFSEDNADVVDIETIRAANRICDKINEVY